MICRVKTSSTLAAEWFPVEHRIDPPLVSRKPRNWKRFNEGQAVNAGILAILLRHPPLAARLTAKQINRLLPLGLRRSETAIQWHMRKIRERSNTLRLPQFIDVVS